RLATLGFDSLTASDSELLSEWSQNLRCQCDEFLAESLALAPWLTNAGEQTAGDRGSDAALAELAEQEGPGAEHARAQIESLNSLAQECEELARMEWEFLFDPTRKLFAVGYNM